MVLEQEAATKPELEPKHLPEKIQTSNRSRIVCKVSKNQ
jgi:hypothetical protein